MHSACCNTNAIENVIEINNFKYINQKDREIDRQTERTESISCSSKGISSRSFLSPPAYPRTHDDDGR